MAAFAVSRVTDICCVHAVDQRLRLDVLIALPVVAHAPANPPPPRRLAAYLAIAFSVASIFLESEIALRALDGPGLLFFCQSAFPGLFGFLLRPPRIETFELFY